MKGQPHAFYEAALASETDECIIWPHAKGPFGYGNMQKDGEKVQVYREVCIATHGPRPPGMEAAHRCGRHGCINPRHIRWATHEENMRDRDMHGRTTHGEGSPNAKLTSKMVEEARTLVLVHPVKDIAVMFGVAPSTMSRAIRGERWRRVPLRQAK